LKVYLDSNIFVYSMFAHPQFGKACKSILDDVENGVLEGVVSQLVPVEVMSVAVRHDPSEATTAITAIYSLPLQIMNVGQTVLSLACKLASKYSISGYDAVHIATALNSGTENIISNDGLLSRVHEIKLTKPLEYRGKRGRE